MGIATLDAAVNGARALVPVNKLVSGTLVAGRPHSYWTIGGNPGAGAAAANTAGGVIPTNATAGALARTNPAAGEAHMLNLIAATASQAGTVLLCDRLLHIQGNSGGAAIDETITTSQTINSTTLPSRCPTSGADDAPSTNGWGVQAAVEVVTATGAGTPTLTLGYTNEIGTAGRTATTTDAAVATSIAGSFYRFGLQAGDFGVRSIQNFTLSATWTSGQLNLVLYRVLAAATVLTGGVGFPLDWVSGGGPRIYDNSCLFFVFVPATTTTTALNGYFTEAHG
jgi:hypothetical protein